MDVSDIDQLRTVTEIKDIRPYALTLKFNTGEIMEVDLEPMLHSKPKDSRWAELLDPKVFQSVHLESEAPTWLDSLDICPDVLFYMGQRQAEGLPIATR